MLSSGFHYLQICTLELATIEDNFRFWKFYLKILRLDKLAVQSNHSFDEYTYEKGQLKVVTERAAHVQKST